MRTNTYKKKILAHLQKNHLLSISDIHKKIPGVDYSTVYRNIEQLVSEEVIKKVVFDKDKILYEINDEHNAHDHFLCIDCGSVDELDRPVVNLDFLKGQRITDIVVKGLCQKCN